MTCICLPLSFLIRFRVNIQTRLLLFCRYVSLNVQYSSGYRMYNKNIPEFLQNRPRFVVAHVLKRWEDCWHTSANVKKLADGKYEVLSATSSKWYKVTFGDETSPPSCECADWNKTKLPCKHFCAVFKNTEQTWNDLSPLYRSLSILNLDEICLNQSTSVSKENFQEQEQVSSTCTKNYYTQRTIKDQLRIGRL